MIAFEEYLNRMQLQAEETIESCLDLVDRKTGIIHKINYLLIEPDDARVFYMGALLSDTSRYFSNKCIPHAGGAGLTKELAMARAIGESIESYCSSIYDKGDFIFSTYEDLAKKGYTAVHPDSFALFSEKQYNEKDFPYEKFTCKIKINWVLGFSLLKKEQILVPACLVYLPYRPRRDEAIIGPSNSIGLACSRSLEAAILKGLYEVIERDAAMITWHNRLSMPQIEIDSNTMLGMEYGRRFLSCGAKWYLINVTSDIEVPTVLALSIDEINDGYASAAGIAANLHPEGAVLKALIESAYARLWVKYLSRRYPYEKTSKSLKPIRELSGYAAHAYLYGQLKMISQIRFLYGSTVISNIGELPNRCSGEVTKDLQMCLEILWHKATDVVAVNVTTPDIKNIGLNVVKVIVPNLQGMDPDVDYLGGRRLYEVPVGLGYAKKQLKEADLNLLPHPFP